MDDIQQISELSFLEANPIVEYWTHEGDNLNGIDPMSLMSYKDVLKWVEENKHKYLDWNRFTFIISSPLIIYRKGYSLSSRIQVWWKK